MSRTKLYQNKDYFVSSSEVLDLDEYDEFANIGGINNKVGRVYKVDTSFEGDAEDDRIDFGTSKHQYQANNETELINKEEFKIKKGKRRNGSQHFMDMIREMKMNINSVDMGDTEEED